MRQILVTLLAAMFAFTSVNAYAAPNCKYGEVNGVCIDGKVLYKSQKQCVIKKCLFNNRCDYKVTCNNVSAIVKRGLIFPTGTEVVTAATIGLITAAAATAGARIIGWVWPDKSK